MRVLLVLLSILVLFSCAPSGPGEVATEVDTVEADIQSITAAGEEWTKAFRAVDAAALASLYATDAVLMPPNQNTVKGRAAVQAWNEEFFNQFGIEEADLPINKLVVNGDWAYRVGSYGITMKPAEGDALEDVGKFIEIWNRQANGSWKIAYDIWNSDTPLPEMAE